jgi:lysylphosphatidylglycerol synthetase-like protein (DUF2156 family)
MLDLILIPPVLLLALGLRAVRRGEFRVHGHLMAAAIALLGLRLTLAFPGLPRLHRGAGLAVLGLAGLTILLGRQALAWREGRSRQAALPRIHRAAGACTLIAVTLAAAAWLLQRGL